MARRLTPGWPEARRYWSAQMEPTPMKIRVKVPMNSAQSFCARLYKDRLRENVGARGPEEGAPLWSGRDSTGIAGGSQRKVRGGREWLDGSCCASRARRLC